MTRRRSAYDEHPPDFGMLQQRQPDSSSVVIRFVKIMFGEDFTVVMYLPPVIAKRLMHLDGEETLLEDSAGQQWAVTLESVGGSLAFARGWHKFALDHAIEEGEFLVFEYTKKSYFVVRIFGTTATERIDFRCQQKKRSRIDSETFSENDMVHGLHVSSKKCRGDFSLENDESGKQLTAVCVEDPVCIMVNDRQSEQENRRLLLDLSTFEMEKERESTTLLDSAKVDDHAPELLAKTLYAYSSSSGTVNLDGIETAPAKQSSSFNGEASSEKFEKPIDLKPLTEILVEQHEAEDIEKKLMDADQKGPCATIDMACTGNDKVWVKDLGSVAVKFVEKCEIYGKNEMLMLDRSGEVYVDQSVESFGAKKKLLHDEASEVDKKHESRSQMAWQHPEMVESPCFKNIHQKFYMKPLLSGCHNSAKKNTESSSKERSNTSREECAMQHKNIESLVSGSLFKRNPVIKIEQLESCEEPRSFPKAAYGIGPSTEGKHSQMFSPSVKTEHVPAPSDDTYPLTSHEDFSVKVKTRIFMELPLEKLSAGRARRVQGRKVVYLLDARRRKWPVLFLCFTDTKAFICNWTNFCKLNSVQPGDVCRFRQCACTTFEVEVDRASANNY